MTYIEPSGIGAGEILFTGNKADLGPACGTGGSHSSKQYVAPERHKADAMPAVTSMIFGTQLVHSIHECA